MDNVIIKKDSELKSLEELGISKKTVRRIKEVYGPHHPLWNIVYRARITIYEMGKEWDKGKNPSSELFRALNDSGYIRHDINERIIAIFKFYAMIYQDFPDNYFYSVTYENIYMCTDGEEQLLNYIRSTFSELASEIVIKSFGLDGELKDTFSLATKLGLTESMVCTIRSKCMEIMRERDNLPRIFYFKNDIVEEYSTRIEELRASLYQKKGTIRDMIDRFDGLPGREEYDNGVTELYDLADSYVSMYEKDGCYHRIQLDWDRAKMEKKVVKEMFSKRKKLMETEFFQREQEICSCYEEYCSDKKQYETYKKCLGYISSWPVECAKVAKERFDSISEVEYLDEEMREKIIASIKRNEFLVGK